MAIFATLVLAFQSISAWTIAFAGVEFAVGNFLLRAAVQLGVSALTKALVGDGPAADPFVIQGNVRTGGDVPRSFGVGPYLTAGSLTWHSEWGTGGGTPNAFYTQVISLSDVPIAGLRRWFLNGQVVTLGDEDPEKGFAATEYNEKGKDHAWSNSMMATRQLPIRFLLALLAMARRVPTRRLGSGMAWRMRLSRFGSIRIFSPDFHRANSCWMASSSMM